MRKESEKLADLEKLKGGKRQKSVVERWKRKTDTQREREREKVRQQEEGGTEIISVPLIRLILKSLVASPLQASLTRPWLASLFRQRLKSTKGMEICFNPGPSKVTLMLQ